VETKVVLKRNSLTLDY